MNATTVVLGDVAEFVRGINFKPEDVVTPTTAGAVACLRTKNVQAELDRVDVWGVDERFVKRPDQFVSVGDILVSSANSWNLVGKCCWIPELPWKTTFGGFVSLLRANRERIDPAYLYRWFSSDRIQATVRSFGQQTTNISNLNTGRCLSLALRLPDLADQKRIAGLLDQADVLRAKRRATLALLDSLTSAVFLEMFGDPVTNQNAFPVSQLADLGTVDRGVSKHRPRNAPELLGGPYPLIQTGEIANSGGYIESYTATYSQVGLNQSKLWPAGTLCITIAANIAKTGILTFDACFPDSVVGFRSDHATVEYVRVWLSFLQKTLEDNAPESAQKNINLALLRQLPIPIPPIAQRQRFADRVAALQRLKSSQRTSMTKLDELFASLQHRAFNGEQDWAGIDVEMSAK